MPEFSHLHCHTQFSLLDGASDIDVMMAKAAKDGMKGVALTDHGNMFGAFKFVRAAEKHGVKPVLGCEFYVVEDRFVTSFAKTNKKDKRFHQLLLAKNEKGYKNLCKLASLGYMEGLYSKWPRIDKRLIEQYSEGLIASSCCIGAEIPQAILHGDEQKAEELLKWWLNIFGEDYYIELQRHRGLDNIDGIGRSQEDVNQVLIRLARKHNVKIIATNDSHYVEEEDYLPHDMLLCINTGSVIQDTKRFKFPSSDFYFKTQAEMAMAFSDIPEALDNTIEIIDKVDTLKLERDILLPAFPLPKGFIDQPSYLRHITYEGAKRRYGEISASTKERLDFELNTIIDSGYPGYFLIVQDFTSTARDLGVSVGPGRGSAAGSAVAYCLGITNIDPIKYDLLFERFLNPERVSMPDIDIDFDDEGRSKVIDYVIEKYGKNQVAQIITYGAMKAKSSVRDTGRVMGIPIQEVDQVAKSIPDNPKATLKAILGSPKIPDKLIKAMNADDLSKAKQLKEWAEEDSEISMMLKAAMKLEGSIRNTGVHACGVIITPGDITDYIPVSVAKKGADLLVSQYDNSVAEDAGLLKMDFLGLKTLTIIKDAVETIKYRHGVDIDIEAVSLEDEKTYELFQRGETVGIFQYESPGMQKHLKALKPNKFADLIAMNALYRPGPMQYIDDFVARKHGIQDITYDVPEMEEYLAETYGITVYQEQVMLLSQKLGGFSKGKADVLRKGMGKKKRKIIDALFPDFKAGCLKNGLPEDKIDKIWKDWEAFASYAFNKSHSTCYAFIAFQTGYLKAHYPSEFMASVLNHNKSDIAKVNFFLRECKRMNIKVLGPDINESRSKFSVNNEGHVRFGLSGLKGVGEGPAQALVEERDANGPYIDFYDFVKRVNLNNVNKKCIEALAYSGGFDTVNDNQRSVFFTPFKGQDTLVNYGIKFGKDYKHQKASSQNSLFGDLSETLFESPEVPKVQPWPLLARLEAEKKVTGIYISGHPLDDYDLEMKAYVNCPLIKATADLVGRPLKVAGIVTEAVQGTNQRGNGWSKITLQDYTGNMTLFLNGERHNKFSHLARVGEVIYIEGKYSKSSYNDNVYFTVETVRQLAEVGQELTNSINILIPINRLTDEVYMELTQLLNNSKGKHKLSMTFLDLETRHEVKLAANRDTILINSELLRALDDLGLSYQINQ